MFPGTKKWNEGTCGCSNQTEGTFAKPPFYEATLFPNVIFLAFLVFLAFFFGKEFLAFLLVFPFFPRNFRGSEERKNPCFFGGFPCLLPKKTRKSRSGLFPLDWLNRKHSSRRAAGGRELVAHPKGPKIENFQDLCLGLKFSSEICDPGGHGEESKSPKLPQSG